METITIFKTNVSVEIINKLLISGGDSPLYTKDYADSSFFSPKKLAEKVKKYGDQYLVYGDGKTVWAHKYPGKLFNLLRNNEILFTTKYIECGS